MRKIVIYQMMTRLFGNKKSLNRHYGTIEENGVGKFSDINEKALEGIKELGVTHVWYTGVIEHSTMVDFSEYGIKKDNPMVIKGLAGSPYAIKDYYDVNPYLADVVENRIAEFEELVNRTHEAGLKVIIDFVPNHLAREYSSDKKPEGVAEFGERDDINTHFSPDNNFYYIAGKEFVVPEHTPPVKPLKKYYEYPAKASGSDVFNEKPDIDAWFETIKLNYGVDYINGKKKYFDPIPLTWKMMKEILVYWVKMGVDGFRCDVAEMVPHEFWAWVIQEVKKEKEVLFIAESYNPNEYEKYIIEGRFDYLYDKVGIYDAVRAVMTGRGTTAEITRVIRRHEKFEDHMLKFLENHDEQRIASEYFAGTAEKGIPALALVSMISKAPIMIYFGQESGEKGEGNSGFENIKGRTTIFDFWGVPAHQRWMSGGEFNGSWLQDNEKRLRKAYIDIINFAVNSKEICNGNMFECLCGDEKVFCFIRYTQEGAVLICLNFSEEELNIEIESEFIGKYKIALAEGIFGTREIKKIDGNRINVDITALGVNIYNLKRS